ncbi:hypothetical protein [Nitrospira sp. Kam-Ns4a]
MRRAAIRPTGLLVMALSLTSALPGCALWHYQLGSRAYRHGDYAEALDHFRHAAQAGDAKSQHNLGLTYLKGEGVASDALAAYTWFALAVRHGDRDALHSMEAARNRLTPAQLAEAEARIREWPPAYPPATH